MKHTGKKQASKKQPAKPTAKQTVALPSQTPPNNIAQTTRAQKHILFYFGSYAHPFYTSLVANPPDGFVYERSIPVRGGMSHTKSSRIIDWLRSDVVLPVIRGIGYPKRYHVSGSGFDGIHAAQYLLRTKTPYVADFEDATAFTWYDHSVLAQRRTQAMLRAAFMDPKLKALLPWTEAARKSLIHAMDLPEEVQRKIHVVYPCFTRTYPARKRRNAGPCHFLFVGKLFVEKGGIETIRAFAALRNAGVQAKLTVVSQTPKDILAQYEHIPGITFTSGVSDEALEALYQDADVFVLPTHYDTFGLVYLEAMARGLPVIATDQFAVPEIVPHNVCGLLIPNHCSRFDPTTAVAVRSSLGTASELRKLALHPPQHTIDALTKAMHELATKPALRERLGENGRARVQHGPFSAQAYKTKLHAVYAHAFPTAAGATQP